MTMAGTIFLVFMILMILAAATGNRQQVHQEEVFIVQKITTNSEQAYEYSTVEIQPKNSQTRAFGFWDVIGWGILIVGILAWIS